MSTIRFRRLRGGVLVRAVALAAAGLFASRLSAQDAGLLRAGGETYRDSLPGESVDGITLDFRQMLPFGGLARGEAVLVDRKDHSALGRGALSLTDVPVGHVRLAMDAGDFIEKLDASPYHFSNDFLPVAYLRGGALKAETASVSLAVFEGRSEQFRGIHLPTVTFAPESLAGATLAVRPADALVIDANVMRTSNHEPASNPLFGSETPESADAYGLGGTLRLTDFWTAQARASYARYSYAPTSVASSGSFLSFAAGSVLDAPRWKVEANYIREGVNYVPLSTTSVGNREGPHALVQAVGDRLTATATFSEYRNNLEGNSALPDLKSRSALLSGSWRVAPRWTASWSVGEQDLSSRRGEESSRFTQRTASSSLSFPTFGSTRVRYQYQTTDEPSLSQRLHEVELEQQPPPLRGVQLVGAVRFQHADDGASSVLYRGGVTGSIRDLNFALQGEWGRDLAGGTIFALNRNRTVTAALTMPLPASIELRVEGYWNRVAAVVNPQSIFVSQATQEELFSINRRALLVRLVRSFPWGRQPAAASGPLGGPGSLPYGVIEGIVFRDRNGNGMRDADEPGVSGIAVRLDDGQTARSDASGRFAFYNVIEGAHSVALDLEVLPVSYNAPRAVSVPIRVDRFRTGRHDFPLIPTSQITGRVEQQTASGERIPFARAVVTLLPGDFSTYTDPEGRFFFANLSPGTYSVRVEDASLPDGAVIAGVEGQERTVSGGDEVLLDPFVFSVPIEEKPIEKIFEREQTVRPQSPRTKPPSNPPKVRERTR